MANVLCRIRALIIPPAPPQGFMSGYTPVPTSRNGRTQGERHRMKELVGIVMGSRSDWETLQGAADTLTELEVPHLVEVVSAHRTPDRLFSYAEAAEGSGLQVIIAGAGGAAHLPGMLAAKTLVPVLGVPVQSRALNGMDSLLSIAQMPAGIPVGTLAIGHAGAVNAALLAAAMLANHDDALRERLRAFRARQTDKVLGHPDPRVPGL